MNDVAFDVIIRNRDVVVSSLNVADIFRKQHKNVLRDIDNLKEDWKELTEELNAKVRSIDEDELSAKFRTALKFKDCFKESNYITKDGRTVRSYEMNRTGFEILVLGFTGRKVMFEQLYYLRKFDEIIKNIMQETEGAS